MTEAVAEAKAQLKSVADGLISFQLHPKKSDGTSMFATQEEKFQHLIKLARRSVPEEEKLVPSATLDVEYSKVQERLLKPSTKEFMMHEIAKHTHGEGAKQHMAKRKLNVLGSINNQSGLANDPVRLRRLENQLELAKSMAAINKEAAAEKATKASNATGQLVERAPEAIAKLKKGGDVSKLTIVEMCAIAFASFNGTVLKGNKAAHTLQLESLIAAQPKVLDAAAAATTAGTTAATTKAPAAAATTKAPAAAATTKAPADASPVATKAPAGTIAVAVATKAPTGGATKTPAAATKAPATSVTASVTTTKAPATKAPATAAATAATAASSADSSADDDEDGELSLNFIYKATLAKDALWPNPIVGMEVEGHFTDKWETGAISEIHEDGTFDVVYYEDGYDEPRVSWGDFLRPVQT